ncbi:hypothetical protein GGS20DRAFT_528025 [Poronia punctata]|nr:hypothetical protein GGS20DRAFT_528025 [Poronia punctata]
MSEKRKRAILDETCRSKTVKRTRHTIAPDLLSPLSDELLVRILSFLPLQDLLNISPVSDRFYHLAGDSQIWKRLYYSRFVLPRALRLPGFRDGSVRDGKLHYSSRRTIWADGRKGGWVDMRSREDGDRCNWKRQYKLRHNWAKGKCAVEELQLGNDAESARPIRSPKVLVKVLEGIAVTADPVTGLRAWDLKTRQLLAQVLIGEEAPSCIALDDQNLKDGALGVALGFTDGSFGTWELNIEKKQITRIYRHEKSSNGEIVGISFSYPYMLTATSSVLISLYTFESHSVPVQPDHDPGGRGETERKNPKTSRAGHLRGPDPATSTGSGSTREDGLKEIPAKKGDGGLSAPYLLTSLKSHTARAPLALSLRRISGSTIASIAYTFSTMRGWSLGIQELHIRPSRSKLDSRPDIITTQLAYSLPVEETPIRRRRESPVTETYASGDGPTSLSYTHPYLLATLPDNTLVLHLCTSSSSSLSITPGIRLWGHTSGISDAEITARGKAVSVSCRGEEIRVWELEGRTNGNSSIEVRPTAKDIDILAKDQWDHRRNWVGFDDEMVIVLKESNEGKESLLVYDFT